MAHDFQRFRRVYVTGGCVSVRLAVPVEAEPGPDPTPLLRAYLPQAPLLRRDEAWRYMRPDEIDALHRLLGEV